jgi:hypothetical protein
MRRVSLQVYGVNMNSAKFTAACPGQPLQQRGNATLTKGFNMVRGGFLRVRITVLVSAAMLFVCGTGALCAEHLET